MQTHWPDHAVVVGVKEEAVLREKKVRRIRITCTGIG